MYPITWKPAHRTNFATGRNGKLPGWVVCHRMVGYLTGTDRHFAREGVSTSTHFGIGRRTAGGRVEISQYVALDDRAFGNGNNVDDQGREVKSEWNRLDFPARPNEHTVSIEHEDGAASVDANGKRGVVDDEVIEASIWLIGVLLTGDPATVRDAGIRFRSDAVVRALGKIPRDATRIVDHHFIAGPLKPYCWRPWLDDEGFPQARYLSALKEDDVHGLTLTQSPSGRVARSGVVTLTVGDEVIRTDDRTRVKTGAARRPGYGPVWSDDLELDGYLVLGLSSTNGLIAWAREGQVEFAPDGAADEQTFNAGVDAAVAAAATARRE